jgi:hypothetical protein
MEDMPRMKRVTANLPEDLLKEAMAVTNEGITKTLVRGLEMVCRAREAGGAAFLGRVEALKQRHGGGVDDFEPARLDFIPAEPFAQKRTGRG